eukprot:6488363-Amphidinium_carterae.1
MRDKSATIPRHCRKHAHCSCGSIPAIRDRSATNGQPVQTVIWNPQQRDKSATDLRRLSPTAVTPADNGRLPRLPTA